MEKKNNIEIEPIFASNGIEYDPFKVKNLIDWDRLTSVFRNESCFLNMNGDQLLVIMRFFVAYYNSAAVKKVDSNITISQFYNMLSENSKYSNAYNGFIFRFSSLDNLSIDAKQASDIGDYIKNNNLMNELLMDGYLLEKTKKDYSRADTTNIFYGLV